MMWHVVFSMKNSDMVNVGSVYYNFETESEMNEFKKSVDRLYSGDLIDGEYDFYEPDRDESHD